MANKYLDTAFVDKAIKFAVDAHANTERRGKGFPYVIHTLEAMEVVATLTNDPELLAAAVLHDTIEDTDVTIEQIRAEFGDRVASIVDVESDKFPEGISEEDSWRYRKQAAIDRLAKASRDSKIVAMGDKLSNMRAISRDYRQQGDKLWSIFHAPGGKADHEWHYRGLIASLSELAGTDAYQEMSAHFNLVFGGPKPELIDIDDYEESGDGFTAISYNCKSDSSKMIKLYADFMPFSEPQKELNVSNALVRMGLNIPRAHRMVTDGKRNGVEFDRIAPKKSIARAISQDPALLEPLTVKFAKMCRELHSTECDTTLFGPVTDHFISIVNQSNDLSNEEKAKIVSFINSVPVATTCCHGDIHIGNVIFNTDTDEFFWIDLSGFRHGNPLFDIGMFYLCCMVSPEDMAQRLFHMNLESMHKIWEVFAREYFGPEKSLEELAATMAPFAALYLIYYGGRDKMEPYMLAFIKKSFGLC